MNKKVKVNVCVQFTNHGHNSKYNHIVLRYNSMATASIVSAIHIIITLVRRHRCRSAVVKLGQWTSNAK